MLEAKCDFRFYSHKQELQILLTTKIFLLVFLDFYTWYFSSFLWRFLLSFFVRSFFLFSSVRVYFVWHSSGFKHQKPNETQKRIIISTRNNSSSCFFGIHFFLDFVLFFHFYKFSLPRRRKLQHTMSRKEQMNVRKTLQCNKNEMEFHSHWTDSPAQRRRRRLQTTNFSLGIFLAHTFFRSHFFFARAFVRISSAMKSMKPFSFAYAF